jgi:hypothetical protein
LSSGSLAVLGHARVLYVPGEDEDASALLRAQRARRDRVARDSRMEGFGPYPGKHPDSVKADPAETVKTAGCVTTGDQMRSADIRARDEEINSPGFEAPAKVPEIDWALGGR